MARPGASARPLTAGERPPSSTQHERNSMPGTTSGRSGAPGPEAHHQAGSPTIHNSMLRYELASAATARHRPSPNRRIILNRALCVPQSAVARTTDSCPESTI
jgi:hypothetical protein